MTLLELKSKLADITGLTETSTQRTLIQLAAEELWNSVDLPNSLQEVRVTTAADRFVTLPWQVFKVRGVKFSNSRTALEINTIHPYYNDLDFYVSDLSCRVLRYVPLHTRITNASTLKFKARAVMEDDVDFNITGEVDNASYVVEPLTLPAGSREVISQERYINIPRSITKSSPCDLDVDIYDASGNLLGTFPNHLTECRYLLCQMYDRCTQISNTLDGCFDVLFKPYAPPLYNDGDAFPDPFAQVVLFKAVEQHFLKSDTDTASVYNEKAAELLKQFTADDVRGKKIKPKITLDKLTTVYAGRL